jgi:hypothetical protein
MASSLTALARRSATLRSYGLLFRILAIVGLIGCGLSALSVLSLSDGTSPSPLGAALVLFLVGIALLIQLSWLSHVSVAIAELLERGENGPA